MAGSTNIVGFGRTDIDNVLARLTAQEIDQLAFGAVQLDAKGTVLQYNAAEASITGRKREDVIGRYMQDLTHADDLPGNMVLFANMVRTGEPYEIEKRYLRPDGTPVWVNVTVNLIRVPGEKASDTALAVVLDIGQRKQVEHRDVLGDVQPVGARRRQAAPPKSSNHLVEKSRSGLHKNKHVFRGDHAAAGAERPPADP